MRGRTTICAMREVDTLLGTSDTLVLMVSRDCNIACDYCCVPPDGHRLDLETCVALIEQAGATSGLDVVAFTGGEPFLYLHEIIPALEACRRAGLPWKAITNAYWAADASSARKTLAPLVELGLVQLSISADPSHQAHLPIERVEIAARVGLELGLSVHVVGSFAKAEERLSDHVALPEHPRLHTASYVVQPFGRARDWTLSQSKYGLHESPADWTCYSTTRYDLLVFPTGDVYPCCSTANDHSLMVYGNVHRDRLADVYQRVRNDFSVQVLKRRDFGYLYDIVRKLDPELHAELPDPTTHVSACSLCLGVFSDPALAGRVRATLEQHRLDLIEGDVG